MTQEEKQIKLAELDGWRRWKFGDAWLKGLRLADKRFGGYVRRVIENTPPNSLTVKLNIDEAWTQSSAEVIKNYTPVSHWVKGKEIRIKPPDYFHDLNAVHELEKVLLGDDIETWFIYDKYLAESDTKFILHATASQRAEALGKTLNLW